ncbi:MFS transporter [Streptacidiphilus monticola]
MPPRLLVGTSLTLMAAGLALVGLVDTHSTWTALLPSMIATGAGMGMFNPPRASLSIAVVEPGRAGMAAGMGETFQQVGVAVGIAAFGALFQHRVVDGFQHTAVAGQLGPQAHAAAEAVAAGAGNQVAQAAPAVSPPPSRTPRAARSWTAWDRSSGCARPPRPWAR